MTITVSFTRLAKTAIFTAALGMATTLGMADEVIGTVDFDGETITVTQTDDGEQVIALGERELGRNYFAGIDRVVEISGEPVALFYLGDGGNACGPSTLIIWRNDEGDIETFDYTEGCDTPAPSISDNGIHFVPYLNPGEERPLKRWSKYDGVETVGLIRFTPEPGTGWDTLAANPAGHPIDFFQNEEIYTLAAIALGDGLGAYVKGLQVASEPKRLQSGIVMASGCVPHNCGSADAFIAVDETGRALYMAQQNAGGYSHWPSLDSWSEPALEAFGIFTSSR